MDEEEQKEGAPAWMVSFGDMMTLILTFFILLVSMSKERQVGLVAKGIGSFVVALRSFGLDGTMDGAEEEQVLEEVRMRFKQPENESGEEAMNIEQLELLRAETALALDPVNEVTQPALAVFEVGSATLTAEARRYIDLLIPSLRPAGRSVLHLAGHAGGNEPGWEGKAHQLAFQRAYAVSEYLRDKHGIAQARLYPRVWLFELDKGDVELTSVDARLVLPGSPSNGR